MAVVKKMCAEFNCIQPAEMTYLTDHIDKPTHMALGLCGKHFKQLNRYVLNGGKE